jgi:DNA anti-recombination protein RmuC
MSLTLEDLKAISDLIDVKLDKQEQNINKRFDQVDKKFEQVDKKFEQIDKRFEQIDKRFEQIDKRFDEQDKRFDKKLDEFRNEFKEMLIDNNVLIAEHVQRVVSESEDRLSKQIHDIRNVVAQNSYDIAGLKRRTS